MAALDISTLIQRYEFALADRLNFEHHWQESADLVLPTRDFTTQNIVQGLRKRDFIFSEVAPLANESLAAALHGMLTNPALRWMLIVAADAAVNEDIEAQGWFYEVTNRMLAYFANPISGFATTSHEIYLDLGAFGNAVCLMRERFDRFTFQARQLSNFYIIEDDEGITTDEYRVFEMSARDIVNTFGKSSPGPPRKIEELARNAKTAQQKHTVLHAIVTNDERDFHSPTFTNMPWASVYLVLHDKEIMHRGGFRENPYLMPRWSLAPEECYGRGPAMMVLPAIKLLNAMEKDIMIASEQSVRPPINVFANSLEGPISTKPGSINYLRSGVREAPSAMQLGVRPDIGDKRLEVHEAKVEEAFFLDSLRLPNNDRMTAEEIVTRRQQGLLRASPVMSRVIAEWLDPGIKRLFSWMFRTGRFPPVPQILRGRQFKIEYNSPMAQSQKGAESESILRALSTAQLLIQGDPAILAAEVNPALAFRAIWINSGADPKLLNTPEVAAGIRRQLAEQQQLAAGASAARDLAAAGRDASEGQAVISGIGTA